MINWIPKEKLGEVLSESYKDFSDENCILIPVSQFLPLFSYKYGGFSVPWGFYIDKDILICQSISKFEFRFPLS